MNVLITDVVHHGNRIRVSFNCQSGHGAAWWVGSAPVAGDRRFVELALEPALTVGADLRETDELPGIRVEGGVTVIIGDATTVADEGYARIEFGSGGLDIEVSGKAPILRQRYRIAAEALTAFDTEY